MDIKIVKVPAKKRKLKPADESKLGFGQIFTDHMFTMQYFEGKGWYDPKIAPYKPLALDPAAMCLHYGQLIFEGMKAYWGKDGSIFLFRPVEALKKLVLLEKDWIPRGSGTSLYIRPTMIATETAIGVHPSNAYLFFIIVGPVGAYYPEGFSPTKIYVIEDYVRAAPGGIGFCKAAANYAASLLASQFAIKQGYTQVLWLDAVERKYVEEVGTSNIFFVIKDELITPPLSGSILPGVTRDSVIKLARSWGVKVSERSLSMDEIVAAAADGTMQEAFASGTAAIVSPIGKIAFRGKEYTFQDGGVGNLTRRLYDEILQIQYGEKDDPFGWRIRIP